MFSVYRYKKRPLESGRFDSQLTNESLVIRIRSRNVDLELARLQRLL